MTITAVKRSDAEIIAFYNIHKEFDFLGTYAMELVYRLPFDKALPYLDNEAKVKPSEWKTNSRDPVIVLSEMSDYMEFAWDKALNHRGISAGRSVAHYVCWLFLIGDEELLAYALNDDNYKNYGAPILWAICKKYGFPTPIPTAAERMAQGKQCGEYEGCGCA